MAFSSNRRPSLRRARMKWLRNALESSVSLSAEAIISVTLRPNGVLKTCATSRSCARSADIAEAAGRCGAAGASISSMRAAMATACAFGQER